MIDSDKGNGRPGRWTIVVSAVLVGVTGWALYDAVRTYPVRPDAWDRLYVALMGLLVFANLIILAGDIRKRYRTVRHVELLTCGACDGRGRPPIGSEDRSLCVECQGEGRIPVYHP